MRKALALLLALVGCTPPAPLPPTCPTKIDTVWVTKHDTVSVPTKPDTVRVPSKPDTIRIPSKPDTIRTKPDTVRLPCPVPVDTTKPPTVGSHEPTGFTPIYRQDFTSNTPQLGANTNWASNTGGNFSILPSYPGFTGGVQRTRFPAGLPAGDYPGVVRFGGTNPDASHVNEAKYRSVYLSFDVLLEGTDWEAGTTNTKLFYLGYGMLSGDNDAAIMIRELGQAPLRILKNYPLYVGVSLGDARDSVGNDLKPQQPKSQNVAGQEATRPLTVGIKHHVEWVFDLGTVDSSNGKIDVWIDGTHIISYTGLATRNSSDSKLTRPPETATYGVFNLSWAPVFTSFSGAGPKTRDDFLVLDNVYVSGVLDANSPGPALAPPPVDTTPKPPVDTTPPPVVGQWGLPPHLQPGFTQAWRTFDGSMLPTLTYGGKANVFGMNAAATQAPTMSIADDPTNPTGSGKVMRMRYPGADDPDWVIAFTNGGGRGPSRYMMAGNLAQYDWNEFLVRMRYRFSPGWTQCGPLPSGATDRGMPGLVTFDTLRSQRGTISTVTDTTKRWVVNQWAGYYLTNSTKGTAFRIVSNTANTLQLPTDPQFSLPYASTMTNVVTYIVSAQLLPSTPGCNTGTKLWFPRIEATASGSGTVHGQAYSFVNRTTTQSGYSVENNTVLGWQDNGLGNGGGYTMPTLLTQINDWDGVQTDGAGAIGLNGRITSGYVARFGFVGGTKDMGLGTGTYHDVEWYIKLNTPGKADGVFRVWVDGATTPIYESTTAMLYPKYMAERVKVGDSTFTVPLEITSVRFDYVFSDPTFGGGLRIPQQSQFLDLQALQVFGRHTP